MILSLPVRDKQGYEVDVGDTIMYINIRHSQIVFNYGKIVEVRKIEYSRSSRRKRWALVVEVPKLWEGDVGRRILRNPCFFKCNEILRITKQRR